MRPEAYPAASWCTAEHDLMWQFWSLVGGLCHGDDRIRRCAEPDVRRQMVPAIQQASHREPQTAGHIEKVLN